jgi:predicted transcriptional regulator
MKKAQDILSIQDDIKFLKAYCKQLQWFDQSLEKDPEECGFSVAGDMPDEDPRDERTAQIANKCGLDGNLYQIKYFWKPYANIYTNVYSPEAKRRRRRQIETIHKIIDAIEESRKKPKISAKILLTDKETDVLYDMAAHPNLCRHRLTISTANGIKESTLKLILKCFEKKGWVTRPNGPRKGYIITEEGLQIYEKISAD